MTKEELKQYSELQEKFAKDVLRVVSFLKEIDEDLKFVCVIENKKRAKLSTSKIHDERGILRIEKYCNIVMRNYF